MQVYITSYYKNTTSEASMELCALTYMCALFDMCY